MKILLLPFKLVAALCLGLLAMSIVVLTTLTAGVLFATIIGIPAGVVVFVGGFAMAAGLFKIVGTLFGRTPQSDTPTLREEAGELA